MNLKLISLAAFSTLMLTSCLHTQVATKRTIKTDGKVQRSYAGEITKIELGKDGSVIELEVAKKPKKSIYAILSNANLSSASGLDQSKLAVGHILKVTGIRTHVDKKVQLIARSGSSYAPIKFAAPEATAAEKARCQQAGGKVQPAGMAQADHCIYQLGDAGQSCSDHSECLGDCLLGAASANAKHGEAAVGECAKTNNTFGCRALVSGGKFEGSLCID